MGQHDSSNNISVADICDGNMMNDDYDLANGKKEKSREIRI